MYYMGQYQTYLFAQNKSKGEITLFDNNMPKQVLYIVEVGK